MVPLNPKRPLARWAQLLVSELDQATEQVVHEVAGCEYAGTRSSDSDLLSWRAMSRSSLGDLGHEDPEVRSLEPTRAVGGLQRSLLGDTEHQEHDVRGLRNWACAYLRKDSCGPRTAPLLSR